MRHRARSAYGYDEQRMAPRVVKMEAAAAASQPPSARG